MLALRAAGGPLPINFTSPRQPTSGPDKTRTRVLVGALAIGLLAMAAAMAFLTLDRVARKVANLTAERNALDADLLKVELDAKRLAAADEFTSREVVALDELYDYTDRVPDVGKVTVTEFDLTALPPKAAPKGQQAAGQKGREGGTGGEPGPRCGLRTARWPRTLPMRSRTTTYYLAR